MSVPQKTARPVRRETAASRPVRYPVRGAAVQELSDVMHQLIEVIRSENAFLESGMPSALSQFIARKEDLATRYVELHKIVLLTAREDLETDPELHARLTATGFALRAVTEENMQRLNDAMAATRRRIESVIAAIHRHNGQNRTYGRESLTIVSGYNPATRLH